MNRTENKIKAIDLDGAFDERIAGYMQKKKGKYTEEEWEDTVSALYKKFAQTRIEALGASPDEYYRNMSDERLLAETRARLEQGVPADGFLRAAVEERENVLFALADGTADEGDFAAELLSDEKKYLEIYRKLMKTSVSEKLKDRLTEIFKNHADEEKDALLALFSEGVERERVADALCRVLLRDDRVFDALLKVFSESENACAAAERLALYGDERAVPYIKEKMSYVGYADWRELKYALETLGGNAGERDFSADKDYLTLQREQEKSHEEE